MSTNNEKHWTAQSMQALLHYIAFNFLDQIDDELEAGNKSRSDLARAMGISKSRVSQIFKNPGNLQIKTMAKLAQAVGLDITALAYHNDSGHDTPINSRIFLECWKRMGKPRDMFDLEENE